MPTITPFLWFNDNAEEAFTSYTGLFPDGRVLDTQRGPDGKLFHATIELQGQRLMLLNGGPMYRLTEAFSLFVSCEGQAEVDRYWGGLLAGGGQPSRCGWLTDRFGVTWQVIPTALMELTSSGTPAQSQAVMQAMMGMVKLDVAELQRAYNESKA